MKLFLSYARQQLSIARELDAILSARGHDVFFDKEDLKSGAEFHSTIQSAVEECDVLIFLISPESIADRRYTLTELRYRQRKVPQASGRLLPVVVKPTLLARVPAYLRTVTLLFPQGNLAADVVDALDRLTSKDPKTISSGETSLAGQDAQRLLTAERAAAYKRLWELTGVLPKWPRARNVPYSRLREFSSDLRDWYFSGAGGLFLSRSAHSAYSAVQNTLEAILSKRVSGMISAEHYDEVRELCSALRTELARSIGAR